jgi:outer membrane protein assembly factor BamB
MDTGTLTGHVYDAGTLHGVAGVAVSNGEHVVRTTDDGTYVLPFDAHAHRFVVMTTPSGYRPHDGFFQRTIANASPADFTLVRSPDSLAERFSFAQVTDLHVEAAPAKRTSPDMLRADLRELCELSSPSFVVVSGDLTQTGTIAELEACKSGITGLDVPIFPMFGGHDGNTERHAGSGDGADTCTRNWEQVFGPIGYSVDWGGWHIVLVTNEDTLFLSSDDQSRRVAWLRNDLEIHRDRPTIFVTHEPPRMDWLDSIAKYGVDAAHHGVRAVNHGVHAVMYGHCHSSRVFERNGVVVAGTPPLTFGGNDFSARGFREVTCSGDTLRHILRSMQGDHAASQTRQNDKIRASGGAHIWEQSFASLSPLSAPVVAGNTILLSITDESDQGSGAIVGCGLDDGAELWRVTTSAGIKNSPVVHGDRVYASSVTGELVCARVDDGAVQWKTELAGHPDRHLRTSPCVSDGVVIAGEAFGFQAFDAETGEPRWAVTPDWRDAGTLRFSPVIANGIVVAPSSQNRRTITGFDMKDGSTVWSADVSLYNGAAAPCLLPDGRTLIVPSHPGGINAIDTHTGETLWVGNLPDEANPLAFSQIDADLLIATTHGSVVRFDTNTRDVDWSYSVGPDLIDLTPLQRDASSVVAAPVSWHGMVCVGGCDGFVRILDSQTGVERLCTSLGSPVTALTATDIGVVALTYEEHCFMLRPPELR